jgi:ABC-type branched-subunit amino acid transport system substrate-binding protein
MRHLTLAMLGFMLLWGSGCELAHQGGPITLAVLVTQSPDDAKLQSLHWAIENANKGGGVAGQRVLELAFPCQDADDLVACARQNVVGNEAYQAVIGPQSSEDLLQLADAFIAANQVVISPWSTASEVARKYGNTGIIWRTTESDIAQVETMLVTSVEDPTIEKISLLTGYDVDSSSFFNWFGFFATELGFDPAAMEIIRYAQDSQPNGCQTHMKVLLGSKTDIIYAAITHPVQLTCIINAWNAFRQGRDDAPRLFLSDGGYQPELLKSLGAAAEGVEGLTITPPPESGFDVAYKARFPDTKTVHPHAANLYDAVLLLAYGLEESDGLGGERLSNALRRVVSYRGYPVGWDEDEITRGLMAIRNHERPDISGATGPLTFAPEMIMDPTESVYGHWRFEHQSLLVLRYYATGESTLRATSGQSILLAKATEAGQDSLAFGTYTPPVAEPEEIWAVILSASSGWSNYRHQADALSQYQILRGRGIPDSHIIMIGADDLADNAANPQVCTTPLGDTGCSHTTCKDAVCGRDITCCTVGWDAACGDLAAKDPYCRLKGVVRNTPGITNPNVYKGVEYDYNLHNFTPKMFTDILAGRETAVTPKVVKSGPASNIYVFIVGHGGNQGLALHADSPEAAYNSFSVLYPEQLSTTICQMQAGARYRRMLIVVEMCHGGVLGDALEAARCPVEDGSENLPAQGVLMLTAANSSENSLGLEDGYDEQLRAWVADQFAHKYASAISSESTSYTLNELYTDLYFQVAGSHVMMYNAEHFGDTRTISVDEFVRSPN